MMFKVKATRGVADLTVLRVSADVLDLAGVVIADRNASSDHVRFASSPGGLSMIEQNVVFAAYWTHPGNPIAEMDHGSRVCAEVLVPDRVGATHIIGAYVPDDVSRERLLALAGGLEVTVRGEMFFR